MLFRTATSDHSAHRLRGLVLGTTLITVAIAAANIVILAQLRQSTLYEVQTDLLRQSLVLSDVVERTFQSVDLVLASTAEQVRLATAKADSDIRQLTNREYYAFLKDKTAGLPQIDTIGILDADGMRLNHSRDWPSPNVDLSYREFYRVLRNNPGINSCVGEPVLGVASGNRIVTFAHPVLENNGKFLGVVFASTALKYFEELFRSTSLGDGYAAALMRQDGTLLARYPTGGQIGKVTPASVLKTVLVSRSGVSRSISPVDEQARLAAALLSFNYPLVVVVTQSEEAAFASWRTTAIIMCLIASIMIVMIIAAAWLIARSWTQQERLKSGACRTE